MYTRIVNVASVLLDIVYHVCFLFVIPGLSLWYVKWRVYRKIQRKVSGQKWIVIWLYGADGLMEDLNLWHESVTGRDDEPFELTGAFQVPFFPRFTLVRPYGTRANYVMNVKKYLVPWHDMGDDD
jgi:hypothetical protein